MFRPTVSVAVVLVAVAACGDVDVDGTEAALTPERIQELTGAAG